MHTCKRNESSGFEGVVLLGGIWDGVNGGLKGPVVLACFFIGLNPLKYRQQTSDEPKLRVCRFLAKFVGPSSSSLIRSAPYYNIYHTICYLHSHAKLQLNREPASQA